MAGPPRAMGPLTFMALRSLIRDLPEDFLARIEVGIADDVKPALERGLRAVRLVDRLLVIALGVFVASGLAVVLSAFAAHWSPDAATILLIASALCGILVVATILAAAATSLLHHGDLQRLRTYVAAMRRSSLARDLA